ncbi:MAG TPA: alpha/beta hydrolase [Gemmataceae bacterium]|jgi:pimeloyl-ACP methyl ester carboxylesterase|nr:alpha/beta hydrolase [Gemmataceae bacterium]
MRRTLSFLALLIGPAALSADTFDSNGIKLSYRDEGEKTGRPVILVHGFLAESGGQWDNPKSEGPSILKALLVTRKYRVVLLDSRGHGKSEKPTTAASYGAEMAEDIVRLMQHLRLEKADIVGYSMGAWAAQKMASKYPDKVRSLTVGGAGLLDDARINALGLLALGLDEHATGNPNARVLLERPLQGIIALPLAADASALAAAARGVKGLKLTEAEGIAYLGKVRGLIGDKDDLRPTLDALKAARDRAGIPINVTDVIDGHHLTAPLKKKFADLLVEFLAEDVMDRKP